MDRRTAQLLERDIRKYGMIADKNAVSRDRSYYVTSLYFDSYNLSDYAEKAGGFLRRKKFRIRAYQFRLGDSENVWLEIKNKYDAKNSKTRIKLTQKEYMDLLSKGITSLLNRAWNQDENKRKEIFWNFIKSPVRPTILVRYKRKAFIQALGDLRITFDSDIETCKIIGLEYNPSTMFPVNRHGIIVEIKFNYLLPYWLRLLAKKYNLRADTFSKYARSLDTIHRFNPIPR